MFNENLTPNASNKSNWKKKQQPREEEWNTCMDGQANKNTYRT